MDSGRLDQDGANHQQADGGSIMNGARRTEIDERKGSNFVDLSTKDGAGLDQSHGLCWLSQHASSAYAF